MNRPIPSFNNEIQEAFAVMRISSKQKLVGSSAIIGNIITNDYDLNEIVKDVGNELSILKQLYKLFKYKFKMVHDTPDMWIVDFKCGMIRGEAIHWDKQDINRGMVGSVSFIDCLLQKSKCKMDIVKYLNGRFIEISEIYYLNINGKTNYDDNEFQKEYIIHELEKDRIELMNDGNMFKALKREYRILDIMNKNKKRRKQLESIFNGPIGYLYYCISNIKTLIIMKEQSFRPVSSDIMMSVQQTIKDDIGKVISYPYSIEVLDKRNTITELETIIAYLEKKLSLLI